MSAPDDGALVKRIALGEDSSLELKRVDLASGRVKAPHADGLADELAAFANGGGGSLVLGVEDGTKEILGIPANSLDYVEEWVVAVCRDRIKPPLYDVRTLKRELPDAAGTLQRVLLVEVPRSLFVHKSPNGYYRRLGSSKVEMAPDVLARLFQERSQSRVIRFDETPVAQAPRSALDVDLCRRFLRAESADDVELRKLRFLAETDDGLRPTVAGLLLGSRTPETWLPHATVQAVAYVGARTDPNYQLDAAELAGPLDEQVRAGLHFVRKNSRVGAVKDVERSERPAFSERAVFEALVNAVAHRDYSVAGSRIRLHLFRDRLELYVPGALANTLSLDSLHLRQYSRNELVVSLLARCPTDDKTPQHRGFFMDRRGDGVPIILKESLQLSGRAAEYSVLDESELRLVIWAAKLSDTKS